MQPAGEEPERKLDEEQKKAEEQPEQKLDEEQKKDETENKVRLCSLLNQNVN